MSEQPDPVDVAEYEAMMASEGRHPALRVAVVLLKVVALVSLVVGVATAILAYSEEASQYRDAVIMLAHNPNAPVAKPPSSLKPVLVIAKEMLVAFFIYVSAAVIELQLELIREVKALRTARR